MILLHYVVDGHYYSHDPFQSEVIKVETRLIIIIIAINLIMKFDFTIIIVSHLIGLCH